jgi:error-prone DNA polymerase
MNRDRGIAYAELHCRSNFSFLRGASHPEELVHRAHGLGYQALALTDECSLAGVVRAHVAAKACGLHLVIGAELVLQDGLQLVLLAMDRGGYGNLSELIARGRRAASKGSYLLSRADLASGLEGCLALWVPGEAGAPEDADWVAARWPGRSWLAVELFRNGGDARRLSRWRELGKRAGLPLVASGGVLMHCRRRRQLQDALTAIRLGRPLSQVVLELQSNGEHHLRSMAALRRFYPDELLLETVRIANCCRFSLDELRYEYPDELVPPGFCAGDYLRHLTNAGMRERWPDGEPRRVRRLVEHELGLINELGYEPYFLTVYDIVRFARSRGILCQGRGSAANSAVCYCLGITEVDPARMELLFERFISRERNEPPDIDVDFEHERREEVIQYIYRKYGRKRAALTATVISYRPKSAVRDLGKALGLGLEQVDRLARNLAWWDGQTVVSQRLQAAGLNPDNPVVRRLMKLLPELLGFPRHLSQHVGGFVISRGPLSRLVPIENAAMPDRTLIQWDKDDLAVLGLLKVDCLALGMLSAIRRAFDLVNGFRGSSLRLHSIPPEDPAVYAMIQCADTIGVFQIESRAQMAMLPRLRPASFYDLVIEVAIVRPGPIQGDMVHPYLRRRNGLEPVSYPSEAVREVLGRTLGVPIFQEQVIKVAMVAAGFGPGEADQVRRSMAAWRRRGGMERFEQRLVEGMRKRGYSERFARQIYQQILGFGEYGFPESHSASFALLVYVSAWLKCHEPAAFYCALLNSQPMGFYAPAQLVQAARRAGVELRPVTVGDSQWDCSLERSARSGEPALRLGLRLIKSLSRAGAERLLEARAGRSFDDEEDLFARARLDRRDLGALAAAGALSELAGNRHQAAWRVAGVQKPPHLKTLGRPREGFPLLPVPTEGQDVVADYANLGLTLGRHPLALLRSHMRGKGVLSARQVLARAQGEVVRTAGLVVTRQRPSSANSVTFITLEDETGYVNLIVWKQLGERQRSVMLQSRLLGVLGEVQREGDVLHLVAWRLLDYTSLLGRLLVRSRDFR